MEHKKIKHVQHRVSKCRAWKGLGVKFVALTVEKKSEYKRKCNKEIGNNPSNVAFFLEKKIQSGNSSAKLVITCHALLFFQIVSQLFL